MTINLKVYSINMFDSLFIPKMNRRKNVDNESLSNTISTCITYEYPI